MASLPTFTPACQTHLIINTASNPSCWKVSVSLLSIYYLSRQHIHFCRHLANYTQSLYAHALTPTFVNQVLHQKYKINNDLIQLMHPIVFFSLVSSVELSTSINETLAGGFSYQSAILPIIYYWVLLPCSYLYFSYLRDCKRITVDRSSSLLLLVCEIKSS